MAGGGMNNLTILVGNGDNAQAPKRILISTTSARRRESHSLCDSPGRTEVVQHEQGRRVGS